MTINSNRIESSVNYPSSTNLREGAANFISKVVPKPSVHSGSYTVTATVSNSAPTHIFTEERVRRAAAHSPSPHGQATSIRQPDHQSLDASELALINKIQRQSHLQASLTNELGQSLSTSPIRAHINQAAFDILKSELQMTKTQLNDARNTHTFLKREKQKAEHERDLAL